MCITWCLGRGFLNVELKCAAEQCRTFLKSVIEYCAHFLKLPKIRLVFLFYCVFLPIDCVSALFDYVHLVQVCLVYFPR